MSLSWGEFDRIVVLAVTWATLVFLGWNVVRTVRKRGWAGIRSAWPELLLALSIGHLAAWYIAVSAGRGMMAGAFG